MKIQKYKKLKSGKYQVELENSVKIELYEDTILKYDLLLNKEIKEIELDDILKCNNNFDIYYLALKYLNIRARSKKEIKDYLKKKTCDENIINEIIAKLESQGYLNDLAFAKSFLTNKLIMTSNGPLKIRRELLQHELSNENINIVLEDYNDQMQLEKIREQISRIVKSNHSKGNYYLKKKLYNELNNEGFKPSLIKEELNNLELEDDTDIAKKEYDKLYKKLSKKYSGQELEFKISQKLYQKGLYYNK